MLSTVQLGWVRPEQASACAHSASSLGQHPVHPQGSCDGLKRAHHLIFMCIFFPVPHLFQNRGDVAPRDVVSGCNGVTLEVLPGLNDPMVCDCMVLLTSGVTWENPGKDTSYQERGFGSHLCQSGFDTTAGPIPAWEAEGAWGCD